MTSIREEETGPPALLSRPSWAGRAVRFLVDALLPPQCLSCGTAMDEPGALCPACWGRIDFLAPPLCAACGQPFEFDPGDGALCGACIRSPATFRRARAVFRYDDASKQLILRFKHADATEGAPAFARWMARAGAELLEGCDLIAAVPMHRLRLFHRRYNQAAMLAVALGRLRGIPADPLLLVRRRRTVPQGMLGRAARHGNVKGAFVLGRGMGPKVAGRRVLLIDDVLTSGATVSECAKVFLGAGAAQVDVLTLARVILPHS